jgi:copper oxidase (laccase) domain-containing protein
MDELYPRLQQALFGSLLGPVDSQDGLAYDFSVLPLVFADTPHGLGGTQHGSAYDGGFEGYDTKVLRQVMGQTVLQPLSPATTSRLCGGGLSGCGTLIDQALADTYNAMVSANGSSNVPSWTQDSNTRAAGVDLPAYDAIIFAPIGLVSQPHIDWQNRPTFQQVAEFPSHRPR